MNPPPDGARPLIKNVATVRRIGKYGVILADLVLLLLVLVAIRLPFMAAPLVTYEAGADGRMQPASTGYDWFLLLCALFIGYAFFEGQYSRRRPFWEDARRSVKLTVVLALLDLAVLEMAGVTAPAWMIIGMWIALAAILPLNRLLAKRIMGALGIWNLRTVIIGLGEDARQTYLMLRHEPMLGYDVTGFIDVAGQSCGQTVEISGPGDTMPLQHCPPDKLPEFLARLQSPHPVFVLGNEDGQVADAIDSLAAGGGVIDIIPNLRGTPLLGLEVSHMFGREAVMLHTRNNLSRPIKRLTKRIFDIVGAVFGLIVLAPFLLYLAVRIRRADDGPALYRQERVGVNGNGFVCLKFRSMRMDAEAMLQRWKETDSPEWRQYIAENNKLRDDPRVTPIGRFLRRTSLDELPQLINVLRGEMSLVGPRPLLAGEITDYGRPYRHYVRVRPGITGLWQVSGRSNAALRDRAAYDDWYVKNWSLWYDIVILIRTIGVVLGGKGAY